MQRHFTSVPGAHHDQAFKYPTKEPPTPCPQQLPGRRPPNIPNENARSSASAAHWSLNKRVIGYCVKEGSGKIHSEGTIGATRLDPGPRQYENTEVSGGFRKK
jgi:hypothetical protein